jgi:hypothetical protein
MTAFAKSNPVRDTFWGAVEDLSLLDAALLSFNIEPSALGLHMDHTGEPVRLDELPEEFLPRIEVLRSAVRTGSLSPTAKNEDKLGRLDETKTRIKTSDFIAWCAGRCIPHNIPNRQAAAPNSIPISGQAAVSAILPQAVATASPAPPQSPYDPLPLNGIATMFLLVQGDAKRNGEIWKDFAHNATKNGLVSARIRTGSGKRQSTFDPSLVGDWLVNHQNGKFDRACVDRILRKNLPPRSAHLKDLLAP